MRRLILASAATLIGGAALAQTMLGQSLPGQNTVVVPPAPPVVAAPASVPAAPTVPAPAPPPGLVQTPFPPSGSEADTSSGDANAGVGAGSTSQTQAVSPSAGPLPSVNNVAQPSGGTTPPSSSTAVTPAQPAPADVAPVPANNWVSGKTAELGVLNKVDGSTSTLSIPVGGQAVSGDLTVSVQACMVRPPGALPDAAIFVTLQENTPQGDGNQIYRGWMVRSAPGATDVGDADEAFRVIACS
ncbi:MAG: DUF2155 domain-containing protein [Proteobacteria bacterium]|nr:DUF2155 domain-containing protein [Pseudomonadota bacterium]